MIRILHVVSSLNINAGMMSVIMNYYRHIDRSKIQFDFLYFEKKDENHQVEIEQLGGKSFYISYPTFKPSDQKKLRVFFEDHKGEYTAVHCHPIWACEVIAREAKRSGIKHIIQHSHSTKFAETKKSEIRNKILMKFVGLFATDYIACSPEARYLFGKKKAKSGKVMILPNAIGLDQYTFSLEGRDIIRNEFNISDDTLLVGNVGRLSPQKNQEFVLEIFKHIKNIQPKSKLFIVGEGDLRTQLEDRIISLNLTDSVIMTGKRRDIKNILSGLDLFLMPSIFEGSPVSAIEARTSRLPCVISDSITKSIAMDGIKYISLNESAKNWAKESLDYFNSMKGLDRSDCSAIIENGFDITKTTEQLQNYYLSL